MIVPAIRGAVCTVMGFTLGVVMKEVANKEVEASIVEREAVTSEASADASSRNQELVEENSQFKEENKELVAENAHLKHQLQEMTQKLKESQAAHERMAKILAPKSNAPAPTPAADGASTSSQDEKKSASKRRGLGLF